MCHADMGFPNDGIEPNDKTIRGCEDECIGVPGVPKFYCDEVCDKADTDALLDGQETLNPGCKVCVDQCVAGCACDEFCDRYKADAGTCNELGGLWVNFNQNFDWIGPAMISLVEIATTEGWVDVMYAGVDKQPPMTHPKRDTFMWWAIFFCIFIFVGSFFILNLCVSVIVDNFGRMKEAGEEVLLTDFQRQWLEARKTIGKGTEHFGLTNLQNLPDFRRKVFALVSDTKFESFIMACILSNSLVMAIKHFPEPLDPSYDWTLKSLNYIFASVFLIEAALKIFTLRTVYFADNWNLFDFTCVMATILGFILEFGFKIKLGVMSGIRLFRIARLFRLLRFAKGLNQLFNAFLLSIPKLLNVAILLVLLLFLFAVMGLHMFSKNRFLDPHSDHANFRNFLRAILTLLRSMTGEGWNELMHSLSKDAEFFGQTMMLPCLNALDVSHDNYEGLKDRGLIDEPILCGGKTAAYIFFIAYTCIITFVILNLFVAVVLEGFEGTNEGEEQAIVTKCIEVWKRFDPNLTMMVPMLNAPDFIEAVQDELPQFQARRGQRIPIKSALLVLGHMQVTDDAKVRFKDAVDGALRLILSKGDNAVMGELKDVPGSGMPDIADDDDAPPIVQEIAALRMQGAFRKRKKDREEKAFRLDRIAGLKARAEAGEEIDEAQSPGLFPGAVPPASPGINKGDMPAAG
jgi:hypothetical protein